MTQHLLKFVSELQRRKVLRIAAAYVVGAWIVLQVSLALQTAMSLSGQFSAAILALLVIGFFVTLVLAWFYEITPEGVKRTAPATGDTPLVKPQTTDLILAGALTLVVIVALVQLFTASPTTPPAATPTTTAEATPAKPEPLPLGDKSIAVLPFANLSTDEKDAYFADGLTEEILNILVRLHGVRVTSRTSSFAFKGKEVGVKEIAKQLAVRHILEGSVRRDGETVRVTAQLIDTASDAHIWSETYERKLADVFTLQDEIARAIAGALNIELSVSSGGGGAPTKNMEAYRLYLKAREQSSVLSDGSMTAGIDLFKRAIELDPSFAEAYAHMATFYIGRVTFDPEHRDEHLAKAREAVETALELKPDFATAYAILGGLAMGRSEWEVATENTDKALAIEPSNAHALMMQGHRQAALGYFQKAHASFEDMAQADPLFSLSPLRFLMLAFAEGDNDAAEKFATKLLPFKGLGGFAANGTLAHAARERGDLDAASKFARLSIMSSGQLDALIEPVTQAVQDPKRRTRAVAAIREAVTDHPAFDPEGLFILIGANDEALDSLIARANSHRSLSAAMMYGWRLVARGEGSNPKLKELMRNAGLVDYWKKHGWPDRCRPKGEDDFECS